MQNLKLTNGLSVRPAINSDKGFLERLHQSTRQDLLAIDGEHDMIQDVVEMQFRAQTQGYGDQFPNALYFIIEKHFESVGKATLDFGSNEVRLIDIAFIPEARGLGFGNIAIRAFQAAAAQVAVPLTLSVEQLNYSARHLYLSLGFQVESVEPPYEFMAWYPPAMRGMTGV